MFYIFRFFFVCMAKTKLNILTKCSNDFDTAFSKYILNAITNTILLPVCNCNSFKLYCENVIWESNWELLVLALYGTKFVTII